MSDDNGLYYMRARYYSPQLLRFINADPEKGTIADGATLNAYAYANGNPISYMDPFGASAELSQAGHTTLDAAGFWPGAGMYFDVTNAVWYAAEGDWANFAWSAIAFIPIGGGLFHAGRLGIKYLNDVGAVNRLIKSAKSTGKQLFTKGAGKNVYKDTDKKSVDEVAKNLLQEKRFDQIELRSICRCCCYILPCCSW
jgi:RHS repeat-associated protein